MKTATGKATSRPGPGIGDEVLVDPDWLAGHLKDADLSVIEVDVSPAAYDDWHIDGAVLWNIYTDLKDADYRTLDTAALERLAGRSGIGPDSTVVFYGYAPALGLWLLKLYEHRDLRILDCSRDAWRAAGHPWSTAASEPPAARSGLGGQNRRIRADRWRCKTPSAGRARPWWTYAQRPSTGGIASGPPAAWSQAAAPVMCRRLSASPLTASTTPMARSALPRSCAASFHRPSSTTAALS